MTGSTAMPTPPPDPEPSRDPDPNGLSIDEAATRYDVHPQTIRKRLAAGDLPGSVKDNRGRWRLDPAEVERVTGWEATVIRDSPADSTPAARSVEQVPTSALQLLDQLGPLLERVSNSERDRADAQAAARIAEHRLEVAEAERDQLRERLDDTLAGDDQLREMRGTLRWLLSTSLTLGSAFIALGAVFVTVFDERTTEWYAGFGSIAFGAIVIAVLSGIALLSPVTPKPWSRRRER